MPSSPDASLDISPGRPQVEYSRHIFGHFVEHFHRQVYGGIFDPGSTLSDERGYRLDVLSALREMGVPNVRWPGGCFVSAYHWLNGVGPERIPVFDPAWWVTEPNTFGTDEFLNWCEELGAAPYICTNAGTGSPEEMASWLEYTNRSVGSKWANLRAANGRTEPYSVPFWSIGNENYGWWEIGAKTAPEWAHFVTESAKLMRRVDPNVELLAAAVVDPEWALPLLEHAGQYLNYISIHGYWDSLYLVNEPSSYLACMALTLKPEQKIAAARALIDVSAQRHVKIAFDEWNLRGWHHPVGLDEASVEARNRNDDNSMYTMADAVFSAAFLNSCIRNGDVVRMANLAPTVNTRGPLFVHPDGIVKRTTFHVMSMYANLLGTRLLWSALTSANLDTGFGDVPVIDAIATSHEDGRLVIAIVNKSDVDGAKVRVRIDGQPLAGTHRAVALGGPHPDAFNDVENPETVRPEDSTLTFEDGTVTIPAHSIVFCFVECTDGSRREGLDWSVGEVGTWKREAVR